MAFRLVVLDKIPGVHLVGIRETLRWALSKNFMRAAGDQAKKACENLQMCAGLEFGIKGETYVVRVMWRDRTEGGGGGRR